MQINKSANKIYTGWSFCLSMRGRFLPTSNKALCVRWATFYMTFVWWKYSSLQVLCLLWNWHWQLLTKEKSDPTLQRYATPSGLHLCGDRLILHHDGFQGLLAQIDFISHSPDLNPIEQLWQASHKKSFEPGGIQWDCLSNTLDGNCNSFKILCTKSFSLQICHYYFNHICFKDTDT